MRSLLPVVMVAACALCSYAQELRGTVRDPSGAVVQGARIVLQDSGQRTERVSDNGGHFAFVRVQRGAQLVVQADGFAPVRQIIVDPLSDLEIMLPLMTLNEELVVTPQRSSVPMSETDAAVVRFPAESLASSGGASLDEKLRQAPGFSLLRRTGSRAANPTTQGASVRGLAASGASRVLVLEDGVPLNDPFGGWVYWDRVLAANVGSVELMQGGASHLYGSGALAGIVNIFGRQATDAVSADVNFGNENTPGGSVAAARTFGGWNASVSAQAFRTEGYVAVLAPDRGQVDTPLTLRYGTATARLDRHFSSGGNAFASLSLFNEGRDNGTPLQINSTRLAELRSGVDLEMGSGRLSLRGYGSMQRYSQTFSAIALDRSRETLASWQRVPAQQAGGGAQWTGAVGSRHSLTAGSELRDVRGVSNEISFGPTGSTPSSAGGTQLLWGAYVADSIRWRRLNFVMGGRVDRWSNQVLHTADSRSGVAGSPHAGAVVSLGAGLSATASYYQSFRAPTLNELYRNFRVGNILTIANRALEPERLEGAEAGIGFARGNMRTRVNAFWNEVSDPVANATLRVTPQLITRQRQNLGSLGSRGVELSVEARLPRHVAVRAAYQFVDATVLTSPANPALIGLLIPQAPRQSMSAAIAYSGPSWTLSAQARASGRQFDDDQNRLPLDALFNLDTFVSRRLASGVELYAAAENVLNQRYIVGRTPTATWGPPILFRAGVRVRLAKR